MFESDGRQLKNNEPSVSSIAMEDIERNLNELTQLLNACDEQHDEKKIAQALTRTNVLIAFILLTRQQLIKELKHATMVQHSYLTKALSELKIQMDGLRSISYSYGPLLASVRDAGRMDQNMQ